MYRKAVSFLVMLSFLFWACSCCIKGMNLVRLCAEPVKTLTIELNELDKKAGERERKFEEEQLSQTGVRSTLGIVDSAVSEQRVIDFCILEQKYIYQLPEEELEILLRIVEAEAGTEDEDGKLLVANVVLNRLTDDQFPDTIAGVVFQKENGVAQFSPIADGAYYQVEISEETMNAVERALLGEDISQGALYFAARKYADNTKMKWFDENLNYLFIHGGHEFFK